MLDLTFGEQVKIVLSRKGMTIKELAEIIEERTGKKMSRQNLTQRLGRDNFQEQDMRMIADILGCPFQLSILADINEVERAAHIEDVKPTEKELSKLARAKERKEERKENKEERKENKEKSVEKAEKKEEAPAPEKKAEPQLRMQRYIVAGRAREESKVIEREMPEFEPSVKKHVEAPVEEPVYEAPVEEYVEEPVYEAPVEEYVEEPVYEAPVEEYAEEPVYEESVEEYEEEPAYEAPVEEYEEEPVYEELVEENTMQVEDSELAELLNEINGTESHKPEVKETAAQEDKKNRGWRSVFQRRSKKDEAPAKKEEPVAETAEAAEAAEAVETAEAPAEEAVEDYAEAPAQDEFLDEGAEDAVYYESDYIDYESTEVPEEEEVEEEPEEEPVVGDINPYTGVEYESNSVRMHPKRIGYVQVYDRSDHQWTDMTEWAFLGYQERKKALLGKDYEEPIYLD